MLQDSILQPKRDSSLHRSILRKRVKPLTPDQSKATKVCQGGEEINHSKDVATYKVVCKKSGHDWGCFNYCSRCVAIDRANGLDVWATIGVSTNKSINHKIE